jgi:hypothetical protein
MDFGWVFPRPSSATYTEAEPLECGILKKHYNLGFVLMEAPPA